MAVWKCACMFVYVRSVYMYVCVCVECVCLYLHTVKVQALSTVGQNNKFRILGCEANSVPRVFLFILDFRKNKTTTKKGR